MFKQAYGIHNKIEWLLVNKYDELRRDENGTVQYEKASAQKISNLLSCPELDTKENSEYSDYIYDLLNTEQLSKQYVQLTEGEYTGKPKYVGDLLKTEIWSRWAPGENVFISAGTGKGKNTFIMRELLERIGKQKVVIFENRNFLLKQQIVEMVKKVDPEALKYNNIDDDSLFVFGKYKNIMIVSYQTAAIKCVSCDQNFKNFCSCARYLVFDEAHYILDDSMFNRGINFFIGSFLIDSVYNQNATKIFMSGTMEEFFLYYQELNPNNYYVDIVKNGMPKYSKIMEQFKRERLNGSLINYVVSMPTDYSYINPYGYKEYNDIINNIVISDSGEKWLIFVNTIEEGIELQKNIQEQMKHTQDDEIWFLSAKNKNQKKNGQVYDDLVEKSALRCKVLIATTVIYNGVNINDDALKNIVLPFTTISVLKQLVGRKRMKDGESLNVYFREITCDEAEKKYIKCIREFMTVLELKNNIGYFAVLESNKMYDNSDRMSKYMYYQNVWDNNGRLFLSPTMNIPAIRKLYFDTCYYIFILKKMKERSENSKEGETFIPIILKEFGIEGKPFTSIEHISEETQRMTTIEELEAYLVGLDGKELKAPDAIYKLMKKINDTYKQLHGGINIDTHWQDKKRGISNKKMSTFFKEISLSFDVKSSKKGDIMITSIRKMM